MIGFEVLVEGASDVPTIKEVLERRFGLAKDQHFRIHPHQGKGKLPSNPLAQPDQSKRQLLNFLPSKLRSYAKLLPPGWAVLVVIDADDSPSASLLAKLDAMLSMLPTRPANVLFCLAVEETESWFIADWAAVKAAYPKAKIASLKSISPDAVVGAWEQLAKAIGSTGSSGTDKRRWAEKICPHLDLHNPPSPSLKLLIASVERELAADQP